MSWFGGSIQPQKVWVPRHKRTTYKFIFGVFFFGKLTYVLKENDTKNIMGIPKIYNVNRNETNKIYIRCFHRIGILNIEFEVIWRSFGRGFNPGT